jgi:hypothetical protein
LALDSRITLAAGGKQDAIVVIAAERSAVDGVMWVQMYRPKGFLASFKARECREQVGTSKESVRRSWTFVGATAVSHRRQGARSERDQVVKKGQSRRVDEYGRRSAGDRDSVWCA